MRLRVIAFWSSVFLLACVGTGCCPYHQESVDDLNSIKSKVPALYDGFAAAPTPAEQTTVQEIDDLYKRTEAREKGPAQCRPTVDSVEQSHKTFDDHVATRQKKLPNNVKPAAIDLFKDQMTRSIDEAIAAIEARK